MSKRFSIKLSYLLAIIAVLIGVVGAVYLDWHEIQTLVSIQIPARDLPAYYQIQPGDIFKKTFAARDIPSNTLTKSQDIVGRYSLVKLPKQKPLTENQLSPKIDPLRLIDTIAVGIPVIPLITLSENLQAGDIVDVTLVPPTTKEGSLPSPIVLANILVLDVKQVSLAKANVSSTSVIVVALPVKYQQKFANYIPGATFLVSRKL
ncbi:hypothetical protein [Nostoc sp. TCL240-02]|uniref:hypothetical protein n=1 Tax=Nostoc sp. TCL240-02 TaxID=2572090 RepID=UPI00157FB383|nr:hypothetical protein [Nostoc sp. TCL240-02]QKQ76892.1 hypothetical protein FBB35_29525 [Nostoc sp. TCL240-02]